MKLAIYIRTIESAQGTERVSANIALGLAERGHHVDFLVEKNDGWLIDKLEAHPNIDVVNLNGIARTAAAAPRAAVVDPAEKSPAITTCPCGHWRQLLCTPAAHDDA